MNGARRQSGFTYLALLFFVATMGIMLALTGQIWSTAQQRIKEKELLFIGGEFRKAIGEYYEHTPGTVKRFPANLDELLLDNRQANTVRHLRRIYVDPMTLKADWGVIRAPDGGIMGAHSKSSGKPVKDGGFSGGDVDFNEAKDYAAWRFIYDVRNKPDLVKPPPLERKPAG